MTGMYDRGFEKAADLIEERRSKVFVATTGSRIPVEEYEIEEDCDPCQWQPPVK